MTDLKTVRQIIEMVVETMRHLDMAVLSRDDETAIFAAVALKLDEQNQSARKKRAAAGGLARSKSLSPERRKEIGRNAAAARWHS